MPHELFPRRIETDRLVLERIDHATDPFEFYAFVSTEDWQGPATEHMPWFRFRRLDQVAAFLENAAENWRNGESARYLIRTSDAGAVVGTTRFEPEWETRRAASDIVLTPDYWGREYGVERASAFLELAFERYDLDAYYTTCAVENEPSRRMIEKYVSEYGGRHEGVLRQYSSRPDGRVTDQHRFSVTRQEYEDATADRETLAFTVEW